MYSSKLTVFSWRRVSYC